MLHNCAVAGNDNVLTNSAQLSDLFWAMGQFIDHDLDLTPPKKASEGTHLGTKRRGSKTNEIELPIDIPGSDFFFSNSTMEFQRSVVANDPDHLSHINLHSAFADLGQVCFPSSRLDAVLKLNSVGLTSFHLPAALKFEILKVLHRVLLYNSVLPGTSKSGFAQSSD